MTRAINILTVFLFGVLLLLPGYLTVTGTALTEPLKENRVKAERPDLWACVKNRSFDKCHLELDAWFNDNYQPRDLLIKAKTQLDYSLFSTSDKVHIGPQGWLYYRSTMDQEKVWGERLSEAEFQGFLDDFDRRLVVLPLPLKDSIHPEFLPGSVPRYPADTRYQKLRRWLADHESIITVDAYDLLHELKRDGPVFHKTDFHWNDPAAYRYARALVNTLWSLQSGREGAIWDSEPTEKHERFSGGQANFLPLLVTPGEDALFLERWEISPNGSHDWQPGAPWNYIWDGSNEDKGVLGGTVMITDSFFDAATRSGIDTYFTSVHRARQYDHELGEVYANIPEGTRYLVFEFIESAVFGFARNGLSVPDTESSQ
jgi:hypothetical protein